MLYIPDVPANVQRLAFEYAGNHARMSKGMYVLGDDGMPIFTEASKGAYKGFCDGALANEYAPVGCIRTYALYYAEGQGWVARQLEQDAKRGCNTKLARMRREARIA